ncbi:MAG: hypothetical protein GKR88_14970 [Flavobacteriaceae bacterium]|nr:MAG: hypothetical protein GKR88_14970 [Flavobacteriaceae bacterium]
MIVKSISHTSDRKSARKLIKYIFDARKPLKDNEGNQLIFKQHIRGFEDKDKWAKQFENLEQGRQSFYANKSVICYHEVISFSDKSTKYLNRVIIKDLVNKYIKLRSNEEMLCVGAVHFEKNKNYHAHLIFSGLKTSDYKSARISKKRLSDIKNQLQAYQINKYPQLEDSVVRHGLKKKN